MEFAILSLLILCGTAFADLSSEYNKMKSINDNYKVYWTYNATSEMMHLAVKVKATGYVGFAFTEAKSSSMKDYDACIYASNELKDYLTNGHRGPTPESQNDCVLDEAMRSGEYTTVKYRRKINTGDSNDVPIKKGEIIVVWVYHPTSSGLTQHERSTRGFAEITMINAGEATKLTQHERSTRGFAEITMINAGEATKLKALYWKFSVALLSVAAVLLST